MRYKAGDRIAIRKDLELSRAGATVTPLMLKFAGKTLGVDEIIEADGCTSPLVNAYRVEETDYVWDDYMIDHEATAKLNETCEGGIPHISDIKDSSHAEICRQLTDMYNQKNADYGDSFIHTRSIIPNAILVRLNDKISRLNKLLTSDTHKVKDESIDDTLMDLANYCIMELMERKREK